MNAEREPENYWKVRKLPKLGTPSPLGQSGLAPSRVPSASAPVLKSPHTTASCPRQTPADSMNVTLHHA